MSRMAERRITWEKVIEEEMLRRLLARRAANLDNGTSEKLQERAQMQFTVRPPQAVRLCDRESSR